MLHKGWGDDDSPEGKLFSNLACVSKSHNQVSQKHRQAIESDCTNDPQASGPHENVDLRQHPAEGLCCLWHILLKVGCEARAPLHGQPTSPKCQEQDSFETPSANAQQALLLEAAN